MQKIMIVDDSPSMRRLLSSFLEQSGYEVAQAVDGVDALEVVDNDTFDLIITDINMPNMDGLTLVTELRKLDATRHIPILVLTTEMDMTKKQTAKESGATGWLNKPFDEERMLSAINRVLDGPLSLDLRFKNPRQTLGLPSQVNCFSAGHVDEAALGSLRLADVLDGNRVNLGRASVLLL
jgi:two-component system chemotaxis response regulator CheY